MEERFTLYVGEKKRFKTGFLSSIEIIYCGMPCDQSYSIGYKESMGNQGYAMNLYYPRNHNTVKIKGREFRIWEVSEEKITLQAESRETDRPTLTGY